MTEEQKYIVEQKFPKFEVRRYEACVFADVTVSGDFESAGSAGFRPLIGYISGNNKPNSKIAMTAPVVQEPITKIAMTSPVVQQSSGQENIARAGNGWARAFRFGRRGRGGGKPGGSR
jgi:LDH2 family malate/lactate/ureidoglycolate dehydrogenase